MPPSSVNLEGGTVKPGIRSGFVATLETWFLAFEQVTYIHGKQFPQL